MILKRRSFLASVAAGATMPLLNLPSVAREPLKVGFVYYGPIGDSGWTFAHDRARRTLVAALGEQIETIYLENVPEGAGAERFLRKLVQDGCKLIFATSFGHMNAVAKVAREFPDVLFEHVSGFQRAANLATYNARFYEGRAVIGTIAGHMSKSGNGGYIASFPIPEVIRGINAFTLAARKVNPYFETQIVWLNSWFDPAREADAARTLIDHGADILTQHTDSPAALQVAEEEGVYGFGQASDMSEFAPKAHLTAITNEWAGYYIKRTQAALDGTWQSGDEWYGMKNGMIDIAPLNPVVSDNAAVAADNVKKEIISGTLNPFAGPIFDQTKVQRVAPDEVLADSQLLAMDWFVDGVRA